MRTTRTICAAMAAAAAAILLLTAAVPAYGSAAAPKTEKMEDHGSTISGKADRGKAHGHHRRHPGHMAVMSKIASVLGMSKDELRSKLASGMSIAEIAKSKGISEDQLIDRLKDSLTDELRQFVRMKRPAPNASAGREEDKQR